MKLVTNDGVGLIPMNARLTLIGDKLEMEGSHTYRNMPVHPLTISLTKDSLRKIRDRAHTGAWRLVEIDNIVIRLRPAEEEPTDPGESGGKYTFRIKSEAGPFTVNSLRLSEAATVEIMDRMYPENAWRMARALLNDPAPNIAAMMVREATGEALSGHYITTDSLMRTLHRSVGPGMRRPTPLSVKPLEEMNYEAIDAAISLMADHYEVLSGVVAYPTLYCSAERFATLAGLKLNDLFKYSQAIQEKIP